jgi:CRISPR-associated endonuclease Csn1
MNRILGDGGGKNRLDHRHHAVDALMIAFTSPGILKTLSEAAERAHEARRRKFAPIDRPWPGFNQDAKAAIDRIVVSHRVSRKVRGQLHEASLYGPIRDDKGNSFRIRKRISSLSTAEVQKIADPAVRRAVQDRLIELSQTDPAKAFSNPGNLPCLPSRDGRKIPIKKVRIEASVDATRVGGSSGRPPRFVKLANNHHVEFFKVQDKRGRVVWKQRVVTLFDAMARLKTGNPVVSREHEDGGRFLFSLCGGDIVRAQDEHGNRLLLQLQNISDGDYQFAELHDARKAKDRRREGAIRWASMRRFQEAKCEKVDVGPLGDVRRAND